MKIWNLKLRGLDLAALGQTTTERNGRWVGNGSGFARFVVDGIQEDFLPHVHQTLSACIMPLMPLEFNVNPQQICLVTQ